MDPHELEILYEDNHLIAVHKPAGILVQGDETGDPTLIEAVKAWLKHKYAKPGNVYLGLVHRLDRPVAGVVLFAKTSKAASRLAAQFREGAGRESLPGRRRGEAGSPCAAPERLHREGPGAAPFAAR